MLAIGFRGGVELTHSAPDGSIALTLVAAVVMASLVPVYCFWILPRRLDVHNAAALAATYGSISAVTELSTPPLIATNTFPCLLI